MQGHEGSAVILAGGKSSRMGRDKAGLSWRGHDMLQYLSSCLASLFPEIIIVSNVPRKLISAHKVVADVIPLRGPLSGIHAGLFHASYDEVFIISCDMPFIVPSAVNFLWEYGCNRHWEALIPCYQHRLEPLFAFYHKKCLEPIKQLLVANQLKTTLLCRKIDCLVVPEQDWPVHIDLGCLFYNINTPADYRRALQLRQKKD